MMIYLDHPPEAGKKIQKLPALFCDQAYDQSEIEAQAANCVEEVYV